MKSADAVVIALMPINFASPIADLRWAGEDHEYDKYVFALTEATSYQGLGGRLFRSDYFGNAGSWSDVTVDLADAVGGDSAQLEAEGVVDLHFHPRHSQKILIQGPGLHHWTTEDFGASYKAVDTPGKTLGLWHELKIHPTQADWILAKVRRNACLADDASISKWCAFDLFVSQDFGHSWSNLTENSGGAIASFWDFDWAASMHHAEAAPTFPDETIMATVYEDPAHMKGPYPGWDKDIHFVSSEDFFKSSHRKIVSCGNQFEVLSSMIYLAMPSDCPVEPDGSKRALPPGADRGNSVSMYISHDEGKTFAPVCLPVKYLDLGYNLIRTHDGEAAFVVVDHDEEDRIEAQAPISNVYTPGLNNTLFTLSLPRNYRRNYVSDFGRVEGLPGVYLGNQVNGHMMSDPAWQTRGMDYENFLQTKVTFNGGGHWQDLVKPDHYRYAKCNRCSGDPAACQLHLHGPSSWHTGPGARPSFYSHGNAPGIVMATGNTGTYLDFAADAACTFLSRDGGRSWEDVADHAAIYEFGDHGDLLVMASHQVEAPTDVIHFSLDQGRCWNMIALEEAIDVVNIRVEPKSASHVFVVHGEACLKTSEHPTCSYTMSGQPPVGKAYVIDLKQVMGDDWKDCGADDYEMWSPPEAGTCLLGRNYTMERRKRDSLCFNGKGWERGDTKFELCPCGSEDVECEYGFKYVNGECEAIVSLDDKECTVLSGGQYKVSETHRRLVHGDACTEVQRVIPDTDGNGHMPNGSSGVDTRHHSGWAAFFIVVTVFGGVLTLFGVWWSCFAPEHVKNQLEEAAAPVTGVLATTAGWAKDKIMGLTLRREAQDAYFQPLAGGDEFALDEEDARSPPLFPTNR
ncbi:hypothetical protein WJX72_003046 [[Myrmecia] bisecta]|uniref:VPS10 domain-containing protein n=1 Tax=[Myrmecia] bisecta TaxID=41462 RepID=A0AAW1R5P2_9CHLO